MRVDNVGICVRDLRRSVAFYGDLGFETLSENDRGVTMAHGEAKLFLFETRVGGPVGEERGPAESQRTRMPRSASSARHLRSGGSAPARLSSVARA
jgi:catechol 2,3-dioxygenase-like lactoylglutathione lyase family enzyme